MTRTKRRSAGARGRGAQAVRPGRGRLLGRLCVVVALIALTGTVALLLMGETDGRASSRGRGVAGSGSGSPAWVTRVPEVDRVRVRSLDALLGLAPDERAAVDIARANLLVARALPGGDSVDIGSVLETLDGWAAAVAYETQRHLYRYREDPGAYEHSEAYFRVLTMITVLQQDCGVRYNPERVLEPDFTDPNDLFIHGMVGGDGGTCVSMPVLYVAIGRRLGYPMGLVTTKGHVFARWEGEDGERFNIEGTNLGLSVYSDEHYRSWPQRVSDEEIARYGFLETLGPDEAIAVFLGSMGHLYADTGRRDEAVRAYGRAARLDPGNAMYREFALGVAP